MTQATSWQVPWDETLIKRYDINAPRYTSYPTALQFGPLHNEDVQQHLKNQWTKEAPLSLYIHIPFCQHICFYCACNKVATKDHTKADSYISILEREMALHALNFGHRPITQLHLGGGTPTFLSTTQMVRLLDLVSIYFDFQPEVYPGEYSIELDPRETTNEMLVLLKYRGFNRVSFGVQDFDLQTQNAINRVQSAELVAKKVAKVRELGFASVNFDMIYGLPFQTPEKFNKTWQTALDLSPDRISLYNYAHLPTRFKPQRRIATDSLPTADSKLTILRESIKLLQDNNFAYIGMDHFAKPTDELTKALETGSLQRNFQGYSTHAETDMLALGVSAISKIDGLYMQNDHSLEIYEAALANSKLAIKQGLFLTSDDQIRQWVIGQLSCQGRLNLTEVSERFNIDAASYFEFEWQQLTALEDDGLVELSETTVQVLPLGRLLLRPVLLIFDAYYNQQQTQRFSKVL